MDEPPVVQSPVGGPRSAGIHLRASKFFQKVSHIRGRIRFPLARKTQDDRDMPYLRQTRSMDQSMMAKPFMSQPLLGLNNIDRDHTDENSSQSASPSGSPSRGNMRKLPTMSVSVGGIHDISRAVTPDTERNLRIDGLPESSPDSPLYITPIGLPRGAALPRPPPSRRDSDYVSKPQISISTQSSLEPPGATSPKRPRSAGGRSTSFQTGVQPVKVLTARPSKSKLRIDPSPSHVSGAQTGVVPEFSAPSSSSSSSPPQLSGLPGAPFRFNATAMTPEGSARLSPTIIARHPPLPLLNLPKLIISGAPESPATLLNGSVGSNRSGASNGGRRRAPLSSMPALPLRGQDGPNDGDDDMEDGAEEDMDEDEEDEEAYHDAEDLHQDDDDDDDHRPRPSMDSFASVISNVRPSTSEDSSTNSRPFLPNVDTSRIDLAFLDSTAETSKAKGKQRAPDAAADAGRTPTQNGGAETDYFSSNWSTQTPGTTSAVQLPLRTPRLGDTSRISYGIGAALTPGMNIGVGVGLGAAADRGRPPIYKHASRSMIDLLSVASRVSEIREEEEEPDVLGASEMRRRSQRKSKGRLGEELLSGNPARPVTGTPGEHLAAPRPLSLHRRRSMPTFTAQTEPPPYPDFPLHPQSHRHDEEVPEGKETLPSYSNAIYLKAIMPRKMEFTKPGEQARDRKWRRVVCELEGTVFRVYRCPPNVAGVGVISGWWEQKVGVGDVAEIPASNSGAGRSVPKVRGSDAPDFVPIAKASEDPVSQQQPTAQVVIPPTQRSSAPSPSGDPSSESQQLPSSRSRLTGFLKPHRPHSRSQSDVHGMLSASSPSMQGRRSRGSTPRSSLSIARPSTSSGSPSESSSNLAGMLSSPHGGIANQRSPSPASSTSPIIPPSSASNIFGDQTASAGSSAHVNASDIPDLGPSELIRAYTLQHAESGLGNDYTKRRNVIRVRMEGEQFLLQAKDMADVVAWIEGFQAATNIALDLDERVMPRGPLFPRRRRRRRAAGGASPAVVVVHPNQDRPATAT